MTRMVGHVFVVLVLIVSVQSEVVLKKDQMMSFQPPFFLIGGNLQHWKVMGNTIVDDDFIKLTSAENSMKGLITSKRRADYENWEVLIEFSIGSDDRQGADGMAFWYTSKQVREGPVFGASDFFTGLGLFWDTFDNDGKRDNPSLYAVVGDGTESYEHDNDGGDKKIGKCRYYYRSRPYSKVRRNRVKVRYEDEKLSVWTDGSGLREENWGECFTNIPVILPKGYYFGFSAETGTINDNHDLYSVQVFELKNDEEINGEEVEENDNPNGFFKPEVVQEVNQRPGRVQEQRQERVQEQGGWRERKQDQRSTTENLKKGNVDLSPITTMQNDMAISLNRLEKKIQNLHEQQTAIASPDNLIRESDFSGSVQKILSKLDSVGSELFKLEKANTELQGQIRKINEEVLIIKSSVEQSSQKVSDSINTHKNELEGLVEKNTSTGTWTYIIIFQLLFAFIFVTYMRSQLKKPLPHAGFD